MTLPNGDLRLYDSRREPAYLVEMRCLRSVSVGDNLAALRVEVLPERGDFVAAVECLNGLFERNCDEQADNNSCNVNKEAFPRMEDLVGSVDIEHRR